MLPSIYIGPLPLILDGQEITDSPRGTLDATTFDVLVAMPDWRASLADAGIIKNATLPFTMGYHSMWVQDYRLKEMGLLTARVAVSCLGLLVNTDKRKTSIAATSSRQSIGPQDQKAGPLRDGDGNMVYFGLDGYIMQEDGTGVPRQAYPKRIFGETSTKEFPAWSVAVAKITLNSTWFTTTRPDHSLVGTAIAPPLEIDTPASNFTPALWENLQFRLNDPAGWVLDSRNIDELFLGYTSPPDGPHYTPPATSEAFPTGLWAVTDTITHYQGAEPI